MQVEKIEYGKPLWNEALDRNINGLNTAKAEKVDVIPGVGTITLSNSKRYPFNNSAATISLREPKRSLDYSVHTEVVSCTGSIGDVEVYDKALNGFKLRFNGSGKQAVIKYYITGGFAE